MGLRQGMMRLTNGAKKTITDSEVKRGYFYITNDKLAISTLGESFDVVFVGKLLKQRRIDSYGRVSISREILRQYIGREFLLKMAKGKVMIDLLD